MRVADNKLLVGIAATFVVLLAFAVCGPTTAEPATEPQFRATDPDSGTYVLEDFYFENRCVPGNPFILRSANTQVDSVRLEIRSSGTGQGTVKVTGRCVIMETSNTNRQQFTIIEGTELGAYQVIRDTLALLTSIKPNIWMRAVPWTIWRGGVLAGGYVGQCERIAAMWRKL